MQYKDWAISIAQLCVCCLDGKDLYIGKAVQKAYLEVTEEGAEGAVGSGTLLFLSEIQFFVLFRWFSMLVKGSQIKICW